jgi:hypothetical protein
MTFDDFLKIPGCTTGSHSSEKTEVKAPVVTANVQDNSPATLVQASAGDNAAALQASTSTSTSNASTSSGWKQRPTTPNPTTSSSSAAPTEENDPEGVTIPVGTKCKRAGCKAEYHEGMERSTEECLHHPLPAIFHEGSKGYACCKRRVLEFDEFLKIEGCKRSKHCFIGLTNAGKEGDEELVQCRHDMYQTPTQVSTIIKSKFERAGTKEVIHLQVICSIFGKQSDKERSTIKLEEWTMHVDLFLPSHKRFTKSFDLYGPIDTEKSKYRILGSKVEVTLQKADGRSWPDLEAPVGGEPTGGKYGAPRITFGVQGRTGTVGAKEAVVASDSPAAVSR